MGRAIIRWSVDDERSNVTGNQVRRDLEEVGFRKIGTGTWGLSGPEPWELIPAVQDALEVLRVAPGGGSLDHVWVYIDSSD